ncbi:MAG TPA: tetrahydrofolate dehydrogenase/cyclohydrolase catalytic domain-containing protein [Nocardioidaceae bacterium]|nr:tetrahydrofolate dehydrogenase/cyclohydrolase catalytic domain-containing protein [Nocardioidaceae bacterium]
MRADGRLLADRLLEELGDRIAASSDVPGTLATLVVDDDARSHRQAALKHRACERVGLRWREVALPSAASTARVCAAVREVAAVADGVFVHLPMPSHVDVEQVVAALPPGKDIDGLVPASPFVAASATGTLDVLRAYEVRLTAGLAQSRVVVLGDRSPLVRGLERLLGAEVAAVTTVGPEQDGAAAASRAADVVVAAGYRPGFLTGDWVRDGAAVVDAASGDVDADSVAPRAGLLCASPGGIGPLTVARLLTATHAAATGRVGTLEG